MGTKKILRILNVDLFFTFIAFCTFFIMISSGISLAASTQSKKIKIGVIASVTGWFAVHDLEDSNEIKIMADMINEKGGININGQKYLIDIVIEDGKSSFDGTTSAANRLVYDKNIKFILGPTAFFSSASGPVTNPNKVINVEGYCTNQPGELDKNTPYSFVGYNSSVGAAMSILKFYKEHYPNVKKLVIISPDDGAPPYLIPIYKKLFPANGFSIIGEPILYANETVDFNPIAAKLNSVKDADGIFMANGIGLHLGGIVKALRGLGNNKPYGAVIVSTMNEVMSIAGKEATENVFNIAVTIDNPENPSIMKEAIKRVQKEYGNVATIYMQGANTLYVLKEAITAAQSLDTSKVKNKWENMNTIQTIFGNGKMGGEQTYGIKNHAVSHPQPMQWVKNGEIIPEIMDIGMIP